MSSPIWPKEILLYPSHVHLFQRFLAPILTPAIFYVLASQWIPIDAGSMFIDILKVVIFPIILGVILRSLFKQKTEQYIQVMPLISVVAIVVIVASNYCSQ